MVLKRSQQIVGKVAAALGIIQGLVGISIPLFVNILHYSPTTITFNEVDSFREEVESAIYKLFIHDDSNFSQDAVLGPKNFVIIMWLYIFLSMFWFVISVSQYIAIQYEKDNQAMHMGLWAMITMIICLFDVITIGLLMDNYIKCSHDTICILAVGTVIGLVARGWTLLFINVIFSYILLIIAKNQTRGMPWFEQTIRIPRARIQRNDADVKNKSTSFSVFSVFEETAPRSPTFLHDLEGKDTIPSPRSPAIRPRSFSNQGSRFTY